MQEKQNPLWDHREIYVRDEMLTPLVDPEEAPTISLTHLRDPLLATVTHLEDLGQTGDRMARQTLFQTRAPFRKGSRHEPRPNKKQEVRLPKDARLLLEFEPETEDTEEHHVQTPSADLSMNDEEYDILINQNLDACVFPSPEDETQEPKNPSLIQMDRSLVDMAFTEGMDLLDDVHNLIMPPQSPTSMLKEIPDFDDYSEESGP